MYVKDRQLYCQKTVSEKWTGSYFIFLVVISSYRKYSNLRRNIFYFFEFLYHFVSKTCDEGTLKCLNWDV